MLERKMSTRKQNGYWKKRANFDLELQKAFDLNNGNRPTQSWLKKNGFGSLVSAAENYYGGLTQNLDQMNSIADRKPIDYWKKRANFDLELTGAIELNEGNRPTQDWLNNNGHGDLVNAAKRYYGGITEVLNTIAKIGTKRVNGYWQNETNFYNEVRIAVRENGGKRPSRKWLKAHGHTSLESAASKYHQGLKEALDKVTNEVIKKPNGYWRNRNNFDLELNSVIKSNGGHRENRDWFNNNGHTDLVNAAKRYYGGFAYVMDNYFNLGLKGDPLRNMLEEYVNGGGE